MRFTRLFIPAICACLLASLAFGDTWKKPLAQGVTLIQEVTGDPKQPEVITIAKIDPKSPGVRIQAVLSRDRVFTDEPAKGNETMSSLAKRVNATVVVNADFFPMGTDMPGDPLNLMVIGGELVSEPSERAVFG